MAARVQQVIEEGRRKIVPLGERIREHPYLHLRALRAGYGLTAADCAFFDLFAVLPPGFEERGVAVVEEGLALGVDPGCIYRTARLPQGYELMCWDAMREATEV